MNWNRLTRIVAATATAASLATLSVAQKDPMQKRVDLLLRDADLHSAIQALTLQTGLQFVVKSGEGEFKKIDLNLSQRTAEEAIKYIDTEVDNSRKGVTNNASGQSSASV